MLLNVLKWDLQSLQKLIMLEIKSAFTPVYGMSPKMMKASHCCNVGTEPSCLGYNGAFQYVQQYGTNKNTIEYQEKYNLSKMMDSGMFGF